jgi:pimeloyl-ACP methyl ester carboxylesterase
VRCWGSGLRRTRIGRDERLSNASAIAESVETRRFDTGAAQLDGVEIYYEVHGDGPPLVLVAGLASDSQSWLPVVVPLAERFTVVAYDNRDVGRTVSHAAEISIPLLADDCAALMEHLGYSNAHVLGHSMGGLIAQELAARHPDRVDHLVLIGTALESTARNNALLLDMAQSLESGADLEAWFREFFRWIFTTRFLEDEAAVTEALRLAIEYPYRQAPEQFRRQVEAVARFVAVDPSQISAKTLVMTGSEDLLFPPEEGRVLAEELPYADFLLVPGTAHSIHMESTDAFVNAVLRFLEGR